MFRLSSASRRTRASKRRRLQLETLETRQLLAADSGALEITPHSQLLIELVNRARENPVAEANRYGIGLNDDVPPEQRISDDAKQPLAPHQALVDAAMAHSLDMLERDYFSHNSPEPNSTTPSDRAIAAGYPVGAGENIGWGGTTGTVDQIAHVYVRHERLFRSVGHRINMLYSPYRELGTGVQYGVFTAYNQQAGRDVDYNASMVTEMFGNRGGNSFITGVAFDDSVTDDAFYDIGEALGGLTVQAADEAGTIYETTTGTSGGYALQVPDGTYTVRFVQAGDGQYAQYAQYGGVVIAGTNIKVDLDSNDASWQSSLSVTAAATLDATTFAAANTLATTASSLLSFGDEFIPVDPSETYLLSGQARSGNDDGGQYDAANRQYLGFASYDADQLRIEPWQVRRYPGAAETTLASPLRPGDTEIVLLDATGWANGGAAHQRSFAWYGYSNSDGYTYPDYTYTRNVETDFQNGLWNPGGISGNVITLRAPWTGPEVEAGTAVGNAVSGGTYNYAALAGGTVPPAWTQYSASITGTGLAPAQFRPGTAYIKPIVLSNYGGSGTNLVRWQNVDLRFASDSRAFLAGTTVDLDVDLQPGADAASYQWTQLAGPAVTFVDANTARASVQLPNSQSDYQVVMEVTRTLSGSSASDTITINVTGVANFRTVALLDATTFGGASTLATTTALGRYFGDRLVPVDPAESYRLTGDARSGEDAGGQYIAGNRQYFGFVSFDADQNRIDPWHVRRFESAADTTLAAALNPGDTQIVLQDASGWANGGAAYQRSFAWYGYTNNDGYTYPDYTYTRNVARDFAYGLWNAGAISGNTITLRQPWSGPRLEAGMAVRNATSGGTYNYAGLNGTAVPNTWTSYSGEVTGTGLAPNQFRPGTAYIQPIILTNYHGNTSNLVQWKNVDVRYSGELHSHAAGDSIYLGFHADQPGAAVDSYQWTQLSGPNVQVSNHTAARPTLTLPTSVNDYQVVMQLTQTRQGVATSDTMTLYVNGVPDFNAVALLDATRFGGQDAYTTSQKRQIQLGDALIAINPDYAYDITADARSGDGSGGQYNAGNIQMAGFASFDADQLQIQPWHVTKYGSANDTRLAAPLRPGDTEVTLLDATGWANAGAAHQRSFAWYGYSNQSGYVYPDYTYTRNVATDFTHGVWDAGGISGNVITLRQPWSGPTLAAGTAVRNATSGGTYNYALLNGQAVPDRWTSYSARIAGVGLGRSQFRPGTAYIRPIVLANYHGGATNLVTWQDFDVRNASAQQAYGDDREIGLTVDLEEAGPPAAGTSFAWTQIAGPAVGLFNANSHRAHIRIPDLANDATVVMRLSKTSGGVTIYDTVTLEIQG